MRAARSWPAERAAGDSCSWTALRMIGCTNWSARLSARIRPARRASAASAASRSSSSASAAACRTSAPSPDDRRRAGEPPGGRGKAGEPRPDRRDDAVGRGAEHVGGAIGSGLAQRARELAEEERVPAGQRMAAAAEGRQGLGDGAAHELADASSLSAGGRSSAGAPPSASISATAAPPGSPSGRAATTSRTGTWLSRFPR